MIVYRRRGAAGQLPAPAACSFCATGRPTGYWPGPGAVVACCRDCATSVLPQLLCDSLSSEWPEMASNQDALAHALLQAVGVFWRTAAGNAAAGAELARKERVGGYPPATPVPRPGPRQAV